MSELTVRENNGTVQGKRYHARAIAPPVDVFENADEVLIIADVPGAPADSIDVRVENGTLILEAKRPADAGVEGDFARTFRMPTGIDASSISAEAKNGTVLVRLPKIAAVKPRKIAVRPA
jgi:HSP20 family protein